MDDAHHEHLTVLERKELSARQVHAALRLEGEEELGRSSRALFWSALSCGLTLGLSLMAQGALRHYLPDAPWRPIVASLGYAAGFIALTLGRQELYTGNTLTAVLPLLHARRLDQFPNLMRISAIVLAGNLLGAWLFAWVGAWSTAFDTPLRDAFTSIGLEHLRYGAGTMLMKGIFGGWLIALMIWLMPGAHHARIWVIVLIAWCISATGVAHVIAGSVDVLFAVMSGQATVAAYLTNFLVPALVGNTIGGVVGVALVNHAQVAADETSGRRLRDSGISRQGAGISRQRSVSR